MRFIFFWILFLASLEGHATSVVTPEGLTYEVHRAGASFFGWDLANEETVEVIIQGKVPVLEAGGIKIDSKLVPFSRKEGNFQSSIILPIKGEAAEHLPEHKIEYFKLNGVTEVKVIDLSPVFREIQANLVHHGEVWFDYQSLTKRFVGLQVGSMNYSQSYAGTYAASAIGLMGEYQRLGILPGCRFFVEGSFEEGRFADSLQFIDWVVSSGFGLPVFSLPDRFRLELVLGASSSTLNGESQVGYASLFSAKSAIFMVFHLNSLGDVSLNAEFEPVLNPGVSGGLKKAAEIRLSHFSNASVLKNLTGILSYQKVAFTLQNIAVSHQAINVGLSYQF